MKKFGVEYYVASRPVEVEIDDSDYHDTPTNTVEIRNDLPYEVIIKVIKELSKRL